MIRSVLPRAVLFPRLAALAGLTWLMACDSSGVGELTGVPDAELGRGGPTDLDRALKQALIEASGGIGPGYFQLPRSDEFSRIPQDPNNRLSRAKVALGQLLFHETALGVDNVRPEGFETYSCAACHNPRAGFNSGLAQGIAEGGSGFGVAGEGRVLLPEYNSNPDEPDVLERRPPSFMNVAFQEVVLWNGQFGGVGPNAGLEHRWTAGTPLESNFLGLQGAETQAHAGLGVHRMASIQNSRVAEIPEYQEMFRAAFRGQRDPINRLNAALAIAAFERTVLANEAPWQQWLRGRYDALTDAEKRGAILFLGEAGCAACHSGPALNSMTFHALGMNDLDESLDPRVDMRPFGGSMPEDSRLGRGGFTGRDEDYYKFKTPQLYNVADNPFLGHGASFGSVREVVEYKNAAEPQNSRVPVSRLAPQFVPLGLGPAEVDDLVAFLEGALYDPDLERYVPARLPSGNCLPVNDPVARVDLGCEALAAR